MHWWSFRGDADLGAIDADPRSASEILASLTAAHTGTPEAAVVLAQRSNGISGYAYGEAKRSGEKDEERIIVWLRSRFAGRGDLPLELLQDGDLDLYLRKRSRELARKRGRAGG